MRRLPAAAALAVLAACTREAGSGVAVRDTAGVRIVESSAPALPDSLYAWTDSGSPLLSIGVENGEEPYQLVRVTDALRLADGHVAISNSGTQEIRVYDSTGRFVERVGRKGAGPGEFGEFSTAAMSPMGDSVIAVDNGAFRVHVFDARMKFVETRLFQQTSEVNRPFFLGVFSDGTWFGMAYEKGGVLRGPPGSLIKSRYSLLRFDPHGSPMNAITTVEAQPRYVHEYQGTTHYPFVPLSAIPLQAFHDSTVYVFRGEKPELEVFSAAGRLEQLIRWKRQQVPTREVWDRYRSAQLDAMSTDRDKALYGDFYALSLPLPEYIPLYTALAVDADGRIWLRRFRLSWDTGPVTWDVIGADGAWLGQATTPDGFTPYRISAADALGVRRDSLGVERVQLLRLHHGEPSK